MKYLNTILTIIAIFLMAISFRLMHIGIFVGQFNEQVQLLIDSNRSLILANQNLKNEISDLKLQIANSGIGLMKKEEIKRGGGK